MTMTTWSGAELKARLNYLGLSPKAFSVRTGRDLRTIARAIRGVSERVSPQMMLQVEDLEDLARTELARWDNTTSEGLAIVIPTLKQPQEPGGLPPHWYQALAGRHIEKWGVDAQIEWRE